jgi:ribonuclease E
MANKMLIDAAHPEETRVVVLRGNRVEEFDFEAANRRQLRGNIYLAKVTRVEPSLQAAFVDYGGNRHGFLAFSEIHPDYYQIPVADRQALIAEDERAHRAAEEEHEGRGSRARPRRRGRSAARPRDAVRSDVVEGNGDEAASENLIAEAQAEEFAAETAAFDAGADSHEPREANAPADHEHSEFEAEAGENQPLVAEDYASPAQTELSVTEQVEADFREAAEPTESASGEHGETDHADVEEEDDEDESSNVQSAEVDEEDVVESVGGADALEEVPDRAPRYRRQYKIQEVIKRRQIMLVQVVKEERGSKGAALTTYLSLAGRYSVLMPNTARGGGISRKITNSQDRARLKEAAASLEVPEGMGVILRTAGAARTPSEIKRDFEYLLRVWEIVRDLTLQSTAPTLVYEEGSLVKRSIRDLYNKDIDEVIVAGDGAYKEAKDFMRMLMPSHAKNVKAYRDPQPVFTRYTIESQLDAMFSPVVQLRSGGYIVLNQTEALVAIDVNSGRATREHHIEDTALKTNLEASEEIARQLRLRDLAGLVVIDFIDMDEKRNNRSVERRLKDALKNDRARIQVGRISHFGLMEMSRQRIRTSVLESSTDKCPTCGGIGHVRSVSSLALQLLRVIDESLLRGGTHNLVVRTGPDVALYILNHKRGHLRDLEQRFQITITVSADAGMNPQQPFLIEKGELVHSPEQARAIAAQGAASAPTVEEEVEDDYVVEEEATEDQAEAAEPGAEVSEVGDNGDQDQSEERDGRKRRKRRRRGGRGEEGREASPRHVSPPIDGEGTDQPSVSFDAEGLPPETEPADADEMAEAGEPRDEANGDDANRRRRRRGRRGGRRNRRDRDENGAIAAENAETPDQHAYANDDGAPANEPEPVETEPAESTPRFESRPREHVSVQPAAQQEQVAEATQASEPARRKSTVRERAPSFNDDNAAPGMTTPVAPSPPPQAGEPAAGETPAQPRRTGWWGKRLLGGG